MRNNSTVRKRAPEVTSFASATKIVVALNTLTGLRPLRYSDRRFWIFLNYSYKMIMITSVGYAMYWIYMDKLVKVHVKNDRLVYLIARIVNYSGFVCILALGGYHSDAIPGLRRRIAVLEESLTKLGAVVNNRNILLWIIGAYISTILHLLVVFVCLGYYIYPTPTGVYRPFFNYITNIGSQSLLEFLTYVCWLKCSFKQTNDLLKKFLADSRRIKRGDPSNGITKDKTNRINKSKQSDLNKWRPEYSLRRIQVAPLSMILGVRHELQMVKKADMLHEIRCIHLHLCGIMKTVNRAFDAQITIYSFVIISNLIIILYNVYVEVKKFTDDPTELSTTSVPVLDVLHTCTKIVITCCVCEGTVKEMKKVIEIIHESPVSDFDVELKDEISQFSLQLSLNKVCNTKSDCFRLGFGFLRQCISSITTYLVILIQWADSMQPEQPLGSNATESFYEQFNWTKRY